MSFADKDILLLPKNILRDTVPLTRFDSTVDETKRREKKIFHQEILLFQVK